MAVALAGVATGVGPKLVADGYRQIVPPGSGASPLEEPASLVVAWPGAQGGSVVAVFGVDPDEQRGAGLLVPAGTQVEVPSLGPQTVGRALRLGGPDLLGLTLENALAIEVGQVLELDEGSLREVLAPAAPLEVRLRRSIVVDGRSYRAGDHTLSAGEAVALVTMPAQESSDLDHLVVAHAVLEAWLGGLDGDVLGLTEERLREVGGMSAGDAALGTTVLDALARSSVTFETLPVESLGVPGEERYRIDEEELTSVRSSRFSTLVSGAGAERPRVEIRNGTGEAGLAQRVAGVLVPEGYEVVLTGNAARLDVEETFVVVHDDSAREEAERLVEMLGAGSVRAARNPVGVVDISVVVGSDLDLGGG